MSLKKGVNRHKTRGLKKVYANNSRRHILYKADQQMHTLGLHCNYCAIMHGMENVKVIEDT